MTSIPAFPTVPENNGTHDKRIRAKGSWQGNMRTTVDIREFSFDIDEPVRIGGTDTAPTPMEFVAGAVNGCVSVVVEQVAKELGIEFTALETYSIATQDTRGFAGTADVSPFFHSYRLEIHVETALDDTDSAAGVDHPGPPPLPRHQPGAGRRRRPRYQLGLFHPGFPRRCRKRLQHRAGVHPAHIHH